MVFYHKMAVSDKWRIYCITDSQWETEWRTTEPTVCPVNAGHTVNSNSASVVEDGRLKEDSDVAIDDAGNIYNINTAAIGDSLESGYLLSVKGDATESGVFVKTSGNASTSPLRVEDNTGAIILQVDGQNNRLGIGNTTPAQALDVTGNIAVSGTVDGRDLATDGAALDSHTANTSNPHSVTKSQVGLGNVANTKTNLSASVNPGATDDSAAGYTIGSTWINVLTDEAFVCVDSTATAAVWQSTTGGGTGDVAGPGSSTDNAVARYDGTTGKIVQNSSGVTIDDANILRIAGSSALHMLQVRNNTTSGELICGINANGNSVFEVNKNGSEDSIVRAFRNNGNTMLEIDNGQAYIGDSGVGGVDGTNTLLVDGPTKVAGTLTVGGNKEALYCVTVRGGAADNGLFLKCSDNNGTYPLRIEDADGTLKLFSMDSNGVCGFGSYTPTYGIDNRWTTTNTRDFNTQNGVYRVGGHQIATDNVVAKKWVFRDEKASGIGGGDFVTGAWRTRTLNTNHYSGGSEVTRSGNQITCAAGKYYVEGYASAYNVDEHQLRVRNITDATTPFTGLVVRPRNAQVGDMTTIHGVINIGASKVFELQHQCAATQNVDGFGRAIPWGPVTYCELIITKIA